MTDFAKTFRPFCILSKLANMLYGSSMLSNWRSSKACAFVSRFVKKQHTRKRFIIWSKSF